MLIFCRVVHIKVLKMVYSQKKYFILSVLVFIGLSIPLAIISQFIFFSPEFIFNVPNYAIVDFKLIIIVSILSSIVTSLSIYRIRMLGGRIRKSGTGLLGSIIGASAGACSCGSFGFAVVSIFGIAGGTATSFLTNYQTPLRLISIAILAYTYYASIKSISMQCKITK